MIKELKKRLKEINKSIKITSENIQEKSIQAQAQPENNDFILTLQFAYFKELKALTNEKIFITELLKKYK